MIRSVDAGELRVEITRARPTGTRLRAEKGINLPDTDLPVGALTEKDLADLPFIAANADMVGLSFVRLPQTVHELQSQLQRLGSKVGIVLKIETRRAFEQLPLLVLAAMRSPAAGVMIARGDLAIETGYERLAEVQEEILWLAEAAHLPVIWATQVLETLAKKGQPTRAEITDAAMAERAECVMLNKGPHIVEALQTLDDILQRMGEHQSKKVALLRQLRAWTHLTAVTASIPEGPSEVLAGRTARPAS
ncbi:MAG: pyruvate kinase [Chloroflexota bacterium]|nr:pyruvate kinase [Chloroflexota bacterium]